MITRGEPTLEAAVEAMRPHVDEVCMAYNGYDEHEFARVQRVADRAIRTVTCNDPATREIRDFAALRNEALSLCTGDAVVWMDSDDTVEGAQHLRELVEQASGHEAVRVRCPYVYAIEPSTGLPALVQQRERLIVGRTLFHWVRPCHEGLVPLDSARSAVVDIRESRIVWTHRRTEFRASEDRNRRILKAYVATHGLEDLRIAFDYGMALAQLGERTEAVEVLTRFVRESGRSHERAQAALKLSALVGMQDDGREAEKWARVAGALERDAFAPPYQCARLAMMRGAFASKPDEKRIAYEDAIRHCTTALATSGDTLVPECPTDRLVSVYETLHEAYIALGKREAAGTAAQVGVDASGGDPGLKLRARGPIPRGPGTDVVFACGSSLEAWNPRSVEQTGIGGSETAVIAIARGLAAGGHRVRVFNRCGREGLYEGVEYHHTERLEAVTTEVDLLVAWRSAALLESIQAKQKWLWLHDTEIHRPTPYRLSLADRMIVPSAWHLDHLLSRLSFKTPQDDFHAKVIPNGVDPSLFDGAAMARNPHRAIYASSPDRGLVRLLDFWPEIRDRVPTAQLYVFYGDAGLREHDARRADAIKARLVAMRSLGVVDHGRVSQRSLAREMLGAGVLAYPTAFKETFCITAVMALCAGLEVVTSDLAALSETTWPAGILIGGDPDSPEYRTHFIRETTRAMCNPDPEATDVGAMLDLRARFDWARVVNDWARDIREAIQ